MVCKDQFDRRSAQAVAATLLLLTLTATSSSAASWNSYAANPQHTAVSAVTTQPLQGVRWSTPVDLTLPAEPILIHYGSPLVTAANTVVIPVKTTSTGAFRVDARNGTNGALIWSQATDYLLPASSWVPSYSPTLVGTRVYFPGAGGTIYLRDSVDSGAPP